MVFVPLCLPVCEQGTLLLWLAKEVHSVCLSWPCRSSRALAGLYCRSLDQLTKIKTQKLMLVEYILKLLYKLFTSTVLSWFFRRRTWAAANKEICSFFRHCLSLVSMLCFTFFGFQEEFQSLKEAEKHDIIQSQNQKVTNKWCPPLCS